MSQLPLGTLRLHRFLAQTRAEGPGTRACLWVQGCPIRCAGCAVPWTWATDGGEAVSVGEMARKILDGPKVEGVTFLGGEPFAQASALTGLAQRLRAGGLSVLTFTGYRLEDLLADGRSDWHALLGVTDLLIDGPFEQELRDQSRPWTGSSNQRYHFLTDRYRHLAADLRQIPNRVEIRIRPDGEVRINGMLAPATLRSLAGSSIRTPRQATGCE